jgi:hypothetical protein
MGTDQPMMGDDEPVGLGPTTSSCNNGNYLAKSLLATAWHNFAIFSITPC